MMRFGQLACCLFLIAASAPAWAQNDTSKPEAQGKPAAQQVQADANKRPAERGDVVDRIVATVNGDLVLASDVEEEERFTRLYPYGNTDGKSLREQAMTRVINRTLIQQQMAGFPQASVTEAQVTQEESDLRKDLPECAKANCASAAGWTAFLEANGLTEDEFRDHLKQRAEVLRFIEQRFRSAVRISDKQISDYYTTTMLPEYARQHATPPALDTLHDRIQELLLQQQVSTMLDDWLKSLRESGRVRILQQGQEVP